MRNLLVVVRRLIRRVGRHRVLALVGVAVVIVLMGAVLFSLTQHVGYGIAVYWAVTTATTVGYGDVTPRNTAGRVIATGVMLTTIPIVLAVFAFVAGASALARIRRILGMDTDLPSQPYTLVYGSHPVIPRILRELEQTGDPIVLVAPDKPAGVSRDVELLKGDPTEDDILVKSQPARAKRAMIACARDSEVLVVAVGIHGLAPQLEAYALTQSPRVARALQELGIAHTLASDELVGHMLAKSLEAPEAGDLLLQLVKSPNYRLAQHPVGDEFVGRPLSDARGTAGSLVLGLLREGQVELGVGDDPILAAGDRLIGLDLIAPA
jgi:voltage-gated potassium channel